MNRSCSKICLIVYPKGDRNKVIKPYAIIDDKSNRSLARSDFFDTFGDLSPTYAVSICGAGVVEVTGRRARGYKLESMDGQVILTQLGNAPYSEGQLISCSCPQIQRNGYLQIAMVICSTSNTDLLGQMEETIPLLSPDK